ncbi:MAG TPA: DNA polymerase III subunit chi [Rickettsiales bacterium]|nr:DNA polymerase III subunit chi [Rickettsiales bacterium]
MSNINFYCIEEDINQFLYSFLTKLVDSQKKVIIYSENQEKMDKLDELLWTMKKTAFLPHLKHTDKGWDRTPLLISNQKENKINAHFLLISNFLDDDIFLKQFEKTFYIFSPVNQNLLNEAEDNWNKYSSKKYNLNFLKKDVSGKWVESKEFVKPKSSTLI